jgi:hypothetical protein
MVLADGNKVDTEKTFQELGWSTSQNILLVPVNTYMSATYGKWWMIYTNLKNDDIITGTDHSL